MKNKTSKGNKFIHKILLFTIIITIINKSSQINLTKEFEMENAKGLFVGGKFISSFSPDIKIIGRYQQWPQKNLTYFDWSGTTIFFEIEGKCDEIYFDLKSAGDYFNVYYNEKFQFKFSTSRDNLVKVVPREENIGVKIVKRTEPLMSRDWVRFKGIYLKGNCKLKPNPKQKKPIIEYVGDSITCGFGVEAKRDQPASLEKSSVVNSFAGILSRRLNSDYYAICCSGMGVVHSSGYNGVGHAGQYYNKNFFYEQDKSEQKVITKPDVIVINLGANDWIYIKDRYYQEAAILNFQSKYSAFLLQIRSLNGKKNGVLPPMIVLGMGRDTAPVSRNKAEMNEISDRTNSWIKKAVEGAGGEAKNIFYRKVDAIPSINYDNDLDYGSGEHWSVQGSEKFAIGAYPVFLNISEVFNVVPRYDDNSMQFLNCNYLLIMILILLSFTG